MRKDIQINVNSETNQVLRNSETLGISTENLQGKIIFKPEPFVDGACRMYIENKGSVLMEKEEDCYTLDIKSSLLITPGIDICFKITEAENEDGIPIFCTQKMYFKVLDTIESEEEIPDQYPTWEEILDSKIAELEALEEDVEQAEQERDRKVDETVENIEDMTEAYNQNAVEKTNEFNTNATNKTTAFDNHVSSKEDEFDADTDTIVSTKKAELDEYETAKENELDTHANSLKNDLDDYESTKETELNSHTEAKETELDTYTNTKKTELDTHEENLEDALDSEAEDLISAFNTNATEKTNNFNTNATNKTSDFNDNATQKTTDFNDNAVEKTTEYDTNATEKVDEYNANATAKIAEYDAHVAELQTEIDELKETVDSELETAVVEGTSIDVSDSAKADGCIGVGGNTEQQTFEGKNLFNTVPTPAIKGYLYGNKFVTRNTFSDLTTYFRCEPNTTYTISRQILTSSFRVAEYDDENIPTSTSTQQSYTVVNEIDDNSAYNITITTTENAKMLLIHYGHMANDGTALIERSKNSLQIEKGSQATDYEPYVGGQASPNPPYPQEIKKVTGDNKIKCTRKNLLPSTVFEFCTITSSGEKIIGNSRICSDFIKVKKLQDYTLRSINQFGFIGVAFYDSNKKYIDRTIGNNIKSIKVSIPAQCSYVKVFGEYGSGTEQSIIAFKKHKMQLELGTATDYEEYKGKEFELNLWTENKFDKNGNIKNNYYLDANGGEVENTGAWFTEYYIEVKPNTLYLIQGGQNFKRICYYDKDKEFISRDNSEIDSLKVITPTNCAYVRLSNNGEYDSLEFKECIELCKVGDYEDILFKNEVGDENYNAELESGAWYKKSAIRKIVLDGTEDGFAIVAKGRFSLTLNDILAYTDNGRHIDRILNDHFNCQTNYSNLYNGTTYQYQNLIYFCMLDNTIDSIAGFRAWLSSNNTTVYYVLEIPTYTKITDTTLISQLEALRKAKWFKGVNHWWTKTNNLEPNLKGTYKQSNNLRLQALEQAVVALGGV